jgi:hypothetical protein
VISEALYTQIACKNSIIGCLFFENKIGGDWSVYADYVGEFGQKIATTTVVVMAIRQLHNV